MQATVLRVALTTHGLQKSGATHGAPCKCPTLLYGAGAGQSRPMGSVHPDDFLCLGANSDPARYERILGGKTSSDRTVS